MKFIRYLKNRIKRIRFLRKMEKAIRQEEAAVLVTYNPQSLKVNIYYSNLTAAGAYDLLQHGALPILGHKIKAADRLEKFKILHVN